jgi:hypothetical protein
MTEGAIRVEITRDKRDYRSAIRANYLHGGGVWWSAGVAAVFFVVFTWIEIADGAPLTYGLVKGALIAILFLAFVTPLNAILLWVTAANSVRQPGWDDPITYTFTPEALEVESSIGAGVTKWAAYKCAFENGRVLVIRHHVNIMQFLPKRQVPTETLSRLRTLLRTALKGRVSFQKERVS